jgi:chromosome segregation ATPase
MPKVELTEEEKAKARAEANRKRQATRAKNEAMRAEQQARERKAALTAELERLQARLPELRDEYHSLLEGLGREKAFDRKKWNKLDALQASILNTSDRLRRLETDLESYGSQ